MNIEMIQKRTGFDLDSAAIKRIEDSVSASSQAARGGSFVQNSCPESRFLDLIQPILVPETWFFRYPESFNFLAGEARRMIADLRRPIRILSVPCSSGEEPYSIAMTLLSEGFSAEDFHIDAVDISRIVLEKARRGTYGKNSFRSPLSDFSKLFFTKNQDLWELSESVKKLVKFHNQSIFDGTFPPGEDGYDIVFCRNMLIYFTVESRNEAISKLARAMKRDAMLFLGHVEPAMLPRNEFESVSFPHSFAFRKKDAKKNIPLPTALKSEAGAKLSKKIPSPSAKPEIRKNISEAPPNPLKKQTNIGRNFIDSILERASSAADRGELEEAEALCSECLQADKMNSRAYFILGLLRLSKGLDKEAEAEFKKAAYIEPDFGEALFHLSLIEERKGRKDDAALLRRRALNCLNKQSP